MKANMMIASGVLVAVGVTAGAVYFHDGPMEELWPFRDNGISQELAEAPDEDVSTAPDSPVIEVAGEAGDAVTPEATEPEIAEPEMPAPEEPAAGQQVSEMDAETESAATVEPMPSAEQEARDEVTVAVEREPDPPPQGGPGAVAEAADPLITATREAMGQPGSRDDGDEVRGRRTPGVSVVTVPIDRSDELQVAEAADAQLPSFDIVRIAGDGAAVIAGRSAPGDDVEIMDRGEVVATVQADRRGEFVWVADRLPAAEDRDLRLRASTLDGDERYSRDRVLVATPRPVDEDGAVVGTERPREPLALMVDAETGSAARAMQVPPALQQAEHLGHQPPQPATSLDDALAALPEGHVSVDVVDYDERGQVQVGGRAEPGLLVQVYLDNQPMARAVTDDDGYWRVGNQERVGPGQYTLRADAVSAEGDVMSRAETPFELTTSLMGMPQDRLVVVQPGNSLWRIARRNYGEGTMYSVIYTANQRQISDPDLIFPGQIFQLPDVRED